jgi:hypothetical protein
MASNDIVYSFGPSDALPVVNRNATAEKADAMSVLKRFDDSNRVGTGMDATAATADRKDLLRTLIRSALVKGNRRHAIKLQAHFNGLRAQGAVITALQVDAAVKYLNH